MMIGWLGDVNVYVVPGVVDMRKAIDGLSVVVEEELEKDPFSGHLFCFCNRRRDLVKILYWDRNGFCLWQKRLERGRFEWPKSEEEVLSLEARQLMWLLEGISINQHNAHESYRYETVL